MARKEDVPQRELEICFRLRSFREATKIPRAVFALSIGISGDRMVSYEIGRVPVRYEVFKAVNTHYRIRLEWLVNGHGLPTTHRAFDDSAFASRIKPRERLSVVYDEILSGLSNLEKEDAEAFFFAPSGLVARLEELAKIIGNPTERKRLPPALLPHIASQLEEVALEVRRAVERDLSPEAKLQRGLKGKGSKVPPV